MHQMSSLHDAKLADVHAKLEDIQSTLNLQGKELHEILSLLNNGLYKRYSADAQKEEFIFRQMPVLFSGHQKGLGGISSVRWRLRAEGPSPRPPGKTSFFWLL